MEAEINESFRDTKLANDTNLPILCHLPISPNTYNLPAKSSRAHNTLTAFDTPVKHWSTKN